MRYAYYTLAFVVVLLLSVMGFRGMTSTRPPIELFPDMDHQAKYKAQAESKFFADGRADRPIPAGAVPYGRSADHADPEFLKADDVHYAGKNADGPFIKGFPKDIVISEAFVDEGPTMKRFRPRAQGRAARINKRTSHITVVVAPNQKSKGGNR